jgi:hypothetical protein
VSSIFEAAWITDEAVKQCKLLPVIVAEEYTFETVIGQILNAIVTDAFQ